ncbi:probable serine/threonine-protein kinase pats1 [Saccostrea cucullata]|uniref:probable serine/threonine-protein kinase pats1 n=1 Tax=Saccostrea cuccullata TaxID=36930 RepID=UPI002ED3B4C4
MPKQISTDSQDFVQFWKNQCCRWNIHPTDWSNGVFDTEIERCFSAYTILSGYQKEFWELVLHKRQWSILILILMSEKYSVLYEEKLLEEKVERIQQTFLTLNGSDDGISDNTLLIQELINKNKILTRNREERLEFKSENIRTLVMGYFSLNCLKTDDDYTNYIKLSSFDSVLEYVRTVDYEDDIKGNLERLKEMNERRESGIDILSSSDSISSSYSMFDYDRKRYLYFPRKMEETLVRESGIDIVRHCIVTQKRIQHFVSDILNIPTEILNWDYEARCRYVKCAKKGTQSIHRARAMIVGCAGAGKTTLLKRLQKKSLDEFQNTQSTIGLEVHEDIFEISKENDFLKALTEETDKEGKQLLSVMDFGGQCVYYACHQVYLSRRAFYLQVIDMSKSFSEKVDPALCEQEETMFADWTYGEYLLFWLKSVHTYCDRDAPVIIVGTHLDKVKDQNSDTFYNSILEHLQFNKHLKKHLDRKRCFVLGFQTDGVSNSDSLSELEKCIVAIAKEDRWRETIPSDWALCEIVFRENRRRKTRLALLEDISYKCFGGNEEKIFQIRDVLKFYHDIGVVLYFNDKNLSETVIIDIQWFIDFFTNIITDPNHIRDIAENNSDWENFYRSGHIPDRLLTCLWNERYLEFDLWHRYEKKTNLLHYMQRLGLFVIGTDAHYIPCMNKRAFGIKEEAYFQSLQTKTSVLVFRFQFLPFFLYYRLIVACLTRTNEEWGTLEDNGLCLYKNVACFAYKQHVVALAVNNSSIQLQIFQQTNCNVLVMKEVALKVRDTVESLLKDLLGNFHTRIDMYTVGYQCCKQEVFREHDDCFVEEKVIYKKGKIPCPRHGLINHHTLCESSLLVYWKLGVKAEISDLDDLLDQDECTRLSEPELRKLNFKTFKKLTKLGRDALQLYFDRLFPPVDLVTTLTTNKDNLKCGQYKMNEDQCTLLFPADKSIPTSSTFDITIMYKLLRNYGPYLLPPSNGWGKKPEIGQKLPTDDVERIRIYRNEMEHKTQTSNVMEKDDFDLKWKDLSQAILRLSNGSLKQDIISLRRQS